MRYLLFHILIVFTTLVVAPGAMAQDGDKKEKLEALKVGFITNRLNLSSEESKTFWPVYNLYQQELEALQKNKRAEKRLLNRTIETLNDKEAEELIDEQLDFEQRRVDLRKKYHAKFKSILPVKKVALLYKSEEDFKRELLKKIQENRK
jgi:hypothetical protein